MAASNCGLQRVRSKSSMRSSTRPPVSAAMRSFIERRIGVAEMERAVWRGRETEDGGGREDVIGHGGKAHT